MREGSTLASEKTWGDLRWPGSLATCVGWSINAATMASVLLMCHGGHALCVGCLCACKAETAEQVSREPAALDFASLQSAQGSRPPEALSLWPASDVGVASVQQVLVSRQTRGLET